jgi:hypothetical protein
MVGTSREETSGEKGIMTIQDHLMSAWKTDESEMVTTSAARRKTENKTKEECLADSGAHD